MKIQGVDLKLGATVAALEGGVPLRGLERIRENLTYGGRAVTDEEWNLATHCDDAARFFHAARLEEGDRTLVASGTDEERLRRALGAASEAAGGCALGAGDGLAGYAEVCANAAAGDFCGGRARGSCAVRPRRRRPGPWRRRRP